MPAGEKYILNNIAVMVESVLDCSYYLNSRYTNDNLKKILRVFQHEMSLNDDLSFQNETGLVAEFYGYFQASLHDQQDEYDHENRQFKEHQAS
jgi:hypothetical protein